MPSAESNLHAFVQFALQKLEAARASLEDDTPEEDYKELCSFAEGMSRHLKAAGGGASPQLRSVIRAGLLDVWDIAAEKPGTDSRPIESLPTHVRCYEGLRFVALRLQVPL